MRNFILFYFIILFSNCSISQNTSKSVNSNDIKDLILSCEKKLSEHNISIKNNILEKVWNKDRGELVDLFNRSQFSWIKNFNIKSGKDVIHFDKIFTVEEFVSMKQQIKNNRLEKWSDLIDEKYFENQKNNEQKKYFSFSIPVFNKDRTIAIVYIEGSKSGELRVYQKNNNEWNYIANGLVWTAD